LVERKIERRLAAILVADVVGYSRLMGHDELRTLRSFREHRANLIDPTIASHGGRIVKTTGDGVLLEFGSVVNAVACGVAIQRGMYIRNENIPPDYRLVLRIGVNLGDIIIDDDDIFGDGVNIAARLEAISAPGGIGISDNVYQQIFNKLPFEFTDLGFQHVKNIVRPVRCYGLDFDAIITSPEQPSPMLVGLSRRRAIIISASAMLVVLGGAGTMWVLTRRPLLQPTRSSALSPNHRQQVAVLPLVTIGGGDEYLAAGLTEDLIAALGRFSEIAVRARSAVIAFKDGSVAPADIGRALEVRYIVEGSVRRAPDRTRVAVRLTDTALGTVLWSETYDAGINDIFAVQDDITRQIAGALSVRLDTLALASAVSKPPGQLEAYDLVLRGRERLDLVTRTGTNQARALFEQAVTLDPNYAAAYVGLGNTDLQALQQGWTGDPEGTLARARSRGQKAVSLEDSSATHRLYGLALSRAGNYDAALDELKRAVTLNPSDAEALTGYGDVLTLAGDSKSAIPFMEEGARFRPNRSSSEYFVLGLAYFLVGRTADSVRIIQQGMINAGQLDWFSVLLAASYAQLGRTADAAREVANVHRLNPIFDRAAFGNLLRRPEDRDLLQSALVAAGL
jgi:adenylate cyclase